MVANVILRQADGQRQVNRHRRRLRLRQRRAIAYRAQCAHFARQESRIQVQADTRHLAALARPQDIACAAQFQVAHGDHITRPDPGRLAQRLQALARFGRHGRAAVIQEIAIRLSGGAPHPPAQLIQVGQTEVIGAVNDDRIRVGDVQPALHDIGAQQDVRAPIGEVVHDAGQVSLFHLPMRHGNRSIGNETAQLGLQQVDGAHPVVHEEHLPLAIQFALDGLLHHHVVEGTDVADDGQAFSRRRLDTADVADAAQAKVERARDGRGRER